MINRTLFINGKIKFTALDPEKDSETLSDWTGSPSFVSHYFDGFFRPYMVSEVKKKMKEMLKKASESNSRYVFAIRESGAGSLVGLVKIGYVSGSNQSTHLYLDLVDEFFAQHAESALHLALQYIFMELSLHRVSVTIPAYNEDEIALYEMAGFLRESQRRQAVYHDGKYYDELVYGLLRPEWMKLQEVAE